MAAASGSPDPDVALCGFAPIEPVLRKTPQEFEFFQAVRLLERVQPDAEPVGSFVTPAREAVRFSVNPSLAFPASRIQDLDWPEDRRPVVIINFMGLYGPSATLPLYYTELILERLRAKDHGIRAFLDIFNHRAISLFYQAWEKYRFPIAYERGERDRFTHHLLDLIGLGTAGLQDRQDVPDESLVYYAGLLSLEPRSAVALEQVISDYFDVPAHVEQFVGAWHELDPATQTQFLSASTYSEQLSWGAIVGDEIWDQQSGVRICLGPLSIRQYLDFLPNGTAYKPLQALARFFGGNEIDFEVQLILKRDEVPPCELGQTGDAAPQLGWVTWAASRPLPENPGDTILRI